MTPDQRTREELAKDLENIRKERASNLAHNVETDAVAASKARQDLAAQLAYDRGVEAARIDGRLSHLDDAVMRINGSIEKTANALNQLRTETQTDISNLRKDMQNRFDKQSETAAITKMENRKLTLQVFSAIIVATISAAAIIIVALIGGTP